MQFLGNKWDETGGGEKVRLFVCVCLCVFVCSFVCLWVGGEKYCKVFACVMILFVPCVEASYFFF